MSAQRPVRMIDIAGSLGVSRATVSLVMRGSTKITDATRDLVLTEADRLGYVYDRGAARLRTGQSDVVAMIMPDIVNPFVGEASIGVRDVLGSYGMSVVITNTTDDVGDQERALRAMIEERVAGIVMITALGTPAEQLIALERSAIPVVLLTRSLPGTAWPFVGSDDREIGRLGAEHLVQTHGCEQVGYLGGNAAASPRQVRSAAFVDAVGSSARIDQRWCAAFDADFATSHRAASTLLEAGPPPPGVLCHSDAVAFGVLRALYEHSIGPERCRVVGIDDVAESAYRTPSVSSIRVDAVAQGRRCATSLLQAWGHQLDPAPLPAPSLVARESCGCRQGPGPTDSDRPG